MDYYYYYYYYYHHHHHHYHYHHQHHIQIHIYSYIRRGRAPLILTSAVDGGQLHALATLLLQALSPVPIRD
jgi:hypothetical protein